MRAVIVQEDKTVRIEERPIPKPGPHQVLLKVICAGANPSDHMSLDMAQSGDMLGTDFVGQVVDMGTDVPAEQVRLGDIRWNYDRSGAFADYICTDWDLSSVVPPTISPYQASTLPLAFMTAVQMLYLPDTCLGLPQFPEKAAPNTWILIWSGATAVGSFAIQLAKLSGLNVATTASPKQWASLRSYGADVVLDYRDPDVVGKLKAATGDAIRYGIDCIAKGDSTRLAQLAFCPDGGHLITALINGENLPRPEVRTDFTFVYTLLGKDQLLYDIVFKSDASHRRLQVYWAGLATELLAGGRLKPLPVKIIGGLDSVQTGMDLIRAGQHEGKLAYRVNPA